MPDYDSEGKDGAIESPVTSVTDSENLIALVERLGTPNVLWEEVEERLAEFPGWLQLVRQLRDPTKTTNNRVVSLGSPIQYTYIRVDLRLKLLELFSPYATLLDSSQTAAERALSLNRRGTDVPTFCRDARMNISAEIADAAKAVLAAIKADRTLLRMADRAPETPGEMLRAVGPNAGSADDLLHPVATVEPLPLVRPGLIARLLDRFHR